VGIKTKFENELQNTLDRVPHTNIHTAYVSARVGKRQDVDDVWRSIQGKGLGLEIKLENVS